MTVNTSERRIERAIVDAMTGKGVISAAGKTDGSGGWIFGDGKDYDRALALDVTQLTAFLENTQLVNEPEREVLDLREGNPTREAFLTLLHGEISQRGVIDVLRRGVQFGLLHVDVFYGMHSGVNAATARRFTLNRFSLTPRLAYSQDGTQPVVDLCLFVNGLPVATFVLKDGVTTRSMADAIERYRGLNFSQEPLLQPGRCMAHFAVDEQQASVCAELQGSRSVFHTFNLGSSEAAGNPSNLFGIATDYIWRRILTRPGVIDIIENYAQTVTTSDTGAASVFPRYHQLELVRRLIADVLHNGTGGHYLVQHSIESGSDQTIAWLLSQLVETRQDSIRIFDSIFVLSERPSVPRALEHTVSRFQRVSADLGSETDPDQVHALIEKNTWIILGYVADFPIILDEISAHQPGRRFAFILDEAPGSITATPENAVNQALSDRAPLPNTAFIVFAPTANEATLERFGQTVNDRGTTKYHPFHSFGS